MANRSKYTEIVSRSDIPPISPELDAYIDKVFEKIKTAQECARTNVRTTDFSLANFEATKRDRLWDMKVKDEFVDSILVTDDGCLESVHFDFVLALDPKEPFWKLEQQQNQSKLNTYTVESDVSSTVLRELVYFAYHRRCQLTDANSLPVAMIAAKYGIRSVVDHCLGYLMEHCSLYNVIKCFQLACNQEFANKQAQLFFKKYIEDNFNELWRLNKADLLDVNFQTLSTILKWDKLNIRSECTVWMVICEWIEHDPPYRLAHLPTLMRDCLRIGRLPQSYIEETIFASDVFTAQDALDQTAGRAYVSNLLHGPKHQLVIRDGHGLLYSKALTAFRPRETRQLLLAAGGWVDGKTTQLIEVYDYNSNLWLSSSVKLSHAVSYFGFEIIGHIMYVFGGSNGRDIFKTLTSLDLTKSKPEWTVKASMHERRCYVSSAVLDGKIYAIGGFNQHQRVRKCERYDPETNQWEQIADLNFARSDASTVTYKGRIYIAGGINDNNIEQSVEMYDPTTNTWTLVKSMETARTSFAVACFGNRIWAIGGNDGEQRLNSVESYNPETDSWQQESSLINNRSTFKAIEFNEELFVVGGYNGQSPICNVEKYIPGHGWTKSRHLRHERSGMALLVIPNTFNAFKL